jgi:NADPH:quinone reductase-like Zn-dependent oxidoreductase
METLTTKETMKAVRIHALGGPDVLRLEEVPRPEPQARELLIHVHAAGVNPVDWKIREGHLGKIALPAIMGSDFSGVIEALGPDITEFRVGEPVFGSVADQSGSYAEYALASVSQVIETPAALDHVQAASLPIPALTAWQALFDAGKLQAAQTVLIHAAAGGVGSLAVQFAKWKGARVIGTASASNADYVRDLGADQVIDYRSTRFEDVAHNVDLVLDTIGGDTQERSWKTLRKNGILVSIVQPPAEKNAAAHGIRGIFVLEDATRMDELSEIADLVVNEQVRTNASIVLPLREARKAQELSQSGHTRGKIVLAITPDSLA